MKTTESDQVQSPAAGPARVLQTTDITCQGFEELEPQSLGVTYWFDAAESGSDYAVHLKISGKATDAKKGTKPQTFNTVTTVDPVVPGSGRIAVTTRVPGLSRGSWQVQARRVRPAPGREGAWTPLSGRDGRQHSAVGSTSYSPVIGVVGPAVRVGAWPALVALGALLGLGLQFALARMLGLHAATLLTLSVLASLGGVIGARVYYLLTHGLPLSNVVGLTKTAGMSLQGFVLTTASILLLGSVWWNLPVGPVLDATLPGLMAGIAIGRMGCLLGGCCAGRPTSSKWGVWSSDRRVAVRRVPAQPMESALAGAVALGGLGLVVLGQQGGGDGLVFVAGMSAFLAGRQLMFPYRALPRSTSWGRRTVLALSALVFVVSSALLSIQLVSG